jgi:hypothetical protein
LSDPSAVHRLVRSASPRRPASRRGRTAMRMLASPTSSRTTRREVLQWLWATLLGGVEGLQRIGSDRPGPTTRARREPSTFSYGPPPRLSRALSSAVGRSRSRLPGPNRRSAALKKGPRGHGRGREVDCGWGCQYGPLCRAPPIDEGPTPRTRPPGKAPIGAPWGLFTSAPGFLATYRLIDSFPSDAASARDSSAWALSLGNTRPQLIQPHKHISVTRLIYGPPPSTSTSWSRSGEAPDYAEHTPDPSAAPTNPR